MTNHKLVAAVYMEYAKCTVCLECGSLWWTPEPYKCNYEPKECKGKSNRPFGVRLIGELPFRDYEDMKERYMNGLNKGIVKRAETLILGEQHE